MKRTRDSIGVEEYLSLMLGKESASEELIAVWEYRGGTGDRYRRMRTRRQENI